MMDFHYIKYHLLPMVLIFSMMFHFGAGSAGTKTSSTPPYGGLAQGFFIPSFNLLTDELQAVGSTIFDSLPSDCIVTNNVGRTQKDFSFFSNTESLYKTVSVNFGIGASLKGAYTLGASVAAVTNNIVSGNNNVSGLSLNMKEYSKDYSLKKDCINKQSLDKQFLEDFQALDSEVLQPWLSRSWNKYKIFLKKYGSHVVKKVLSGSSIQQYVFAESSKQYTKRDFEVKACLSLGNVATGNGTTGNGTTGNGTTGRGTTGKGKTGKGTTGNGTTGNGTTGNGTKRGGLELCAGISQDEINSAGSLSTVEKLVVRGGTSKTRSQLTNDNVLDKNTIGNFLQEGSSNPSPIMYNFIAIWDILKTRFVGTQSMAKALNLEQYFKGFRNFDCSFKETSNNQVLQKFILSNNSDPSLPTYQCVLGPSGCHSDKDCHYKHPFWCACAGESCIRYQSAILNSGTTKQEAYANTILSPGWKGQGCKLRGKCKCRNKNTSWKVSWSGDTAGEGLRDIHFALAKGRSHVRREKGH